MLCQSQISEIREDFPALHRKHPKYNTLPIYLDNACVSLKPTPVIESVTSYISEYSGCGGHRSGHWFADITEMKSNQSRESLALLLGIAPIYRHTGEKVYPLLFTRNTSESINLVAASLGLTKGEGIVLSNKEHNSNLCPWQERERVGANLYFVSVKTDNTFDLEAFKKVLRREKSIKLVAIHHCSNLDGVSTPLEDIILAVRAEEHRMSKHIYIAVDGAQAAPHTLVNLGYPDKPSYLDVDFYAGSIHKMVGPSGMGFLYAKAECLDFMPPFLVGGSTIVDTSIHHMPVYAEWPHRFEAGLQDYAGVHGSGAAAEYLMPLMPEIKTYEVHLNNIVTQAIKPLLDSGKLSLLGPSDSRERGGVCTLVANMGESHPTLQRFSQLTNKHSMMFRTGFFCVDSWFSSNSKLFSGEYTPMRFSFYFYNSESEAELLGELLNKTFN